MSRVTDFAIYFMIGWVMSFAACVPNLRSMVCREACARYGAHHNVSISASWAYSDGMCACRDDAQGVAVTCAVPTHDEVCE